jgi:LAO/AO transport system kinase
LLNSSPDVGQLRTQIAKRDRQALARLLTWIEAGDPQADAAELQLEEGCTPEAYVVGITGAPGAGKSTLVNALVSTLRNRGSSMGVIAVDPSSPYTGGAMLGDRVRMVEHLTDEHVFIRSMANRGQLGGLAEAVPRAVRAMQSFGFDWILVETVGVGQVEVDIAKAADSIIVVVPPGSGDDIQASKSGILEVADLFVVNKADCVGAEDMKRAIIAALKMNPNYEIGWSAPVVLAVASTGDVADVIESLDRHRSHASDSGELVQRRRRRRIAEWRSDVIRQILQRTNSDLDSPDLDSLRDQVAASAVSPAAAARAFLDGEPGRLY